MNVGKKMSLGKIFRDAVTIAAKEMDLMLRFKISFFSTGLVGPFMRVVPFLFLYSGFFVFSSAGSLGIVNQGNYMVFLFLGMLADLFIELGYKGFASRFLMEKYWQTIDGILMAPVSKFSLIFGIGAGDLLASLPSIIIFSIFAYLLIPIPPFNFAMVLFVLLLMMLVTLSVGLVYGAAALASENWVVLFEYGRAAWIFLSCLYYPITIFSPSAYTGIMHTVFSVIYFCAWINPLYQGNYIIRALWLEPGTPFPLFSLLYILCFVILMPIVSVKLFSLVLRKKGIQGY